MTAAILIDRPITTVGEPFHRPGGRYLPALTREATGAAPDPRARLTLGLSLSRNGSCFATIARELSILKRSAGWLVVKEAEGFGIQRQGVERVLTTCEVGLEEVERSASRHETMVVDTAGATVRDSAGIEESGQGRQRHADELARLIHREIIGIAGADLDFGHPTVSPLAIDAAIDLRTGFRAGRADEQRYFRAVESSHGNESLNAVAAASTHRRIAALNVSAAVTGPSPGKDMRIARRSGSGSAQAESILMCQRSASSIASQTVNPARGPRPK